MGYVLTGLDSFNIQTEAALLIAVVIIDVIIIALVVWYVRSKNRKWYSRGKGSKIDGPRSRSVVLIGNYALYDDFIRISPKKCVYYDEITSVKYVSDFQKRVVITVGHAWEISLSCQDQTPELYRGIMTRMNSENVSQIISRKKRLLN